MDTEFVSVGLYKEHLVSYNVKSDDGAHFIATLRKYKGNSRMLPPTAVVLFRQGNNWWSNADKELMAFLVHDISGKLKKISDSRKEKSKCPTPIDYASFAGGMGEIIYKSF